MRGKFNSIIETIGDTPIVRINRLAPEGVTMWAKLEAFNPLGSVKDLFSLEYNMTWLKIYQILVMQRYIVILAQKLMKQ